MSSLIYTRNKPKRKKPTAKQLRDLEEAKKAAEELKAKWDSVPKFADKNRPKKAKKGKVVPVVKEGPPALTTPPGRSTTNHLPSKVTKGGDTAVKEQQKYTGTKMLGVATMHKSNGVAVFSDEHLVDIANMRRNDYTQKVKKNPKDDDG